MEKPNVRVGIGVFVFKDGKFLIQKRKGSHGEGSWSLPGGHLEFGESFEETARREVMEEAGIEIKNIRFGAVTNDHFVDENKHYVTIWMLSEWASGQVRTWSQRNARLKLGIPSTIFRHRSFLHGISSLNRIS